jgi:hypothetical protein
MKAFGGLCLGILLLCWLAGDALGPIIIGFGALLLLCILLAAFGK